jgi:excisionase family DNA binding protein
MRMKDPVQRADAPPAEYLQLAAAALLVSLSKTTLRRAIAAGHLPARVMTLAPGSRTRRVLIRRADLLAWVERTFAPAEAPLADVRREAAALVARSRRA